MLVCCVINIKTNIGLLARGLAEIGPRGGIEGWRWILIIEGLLVGHVGSGHTFISDYS
jgi:hypothetical protein